jgi:hypothetical protein
MSRVVVEGPGEKGSKRRSGENPRSEGWAPEHGPSTTQTLFAVWSTPRKP